jgi:hypothetical protein
MEAEQRRRGELRDAYRYLMDTLPIVHNQMATRPILLDRGESYLHSNFNH